MGGGGGGGGRTDFSKGRSLFSPPPPKNKNKNKRNRKQQQNKQTNKKNLGSFKGHFCYFNDPSQFDIRDAPQDAVSQSAVRNSATVHELIHCLCPFLIRYTVNRAHVHVKGFGMTLCAC